MPPLRQLVLGLGNRLSGLDAFGPAVVDRLLELASRPGIAVEDAGCDLLACLDRLASFDRVILVDAVLGMPGDPRVVLLDEEDLASWPDSAVSCHQVSPVVALRLFRTLNPDARTRITIVALSCTRISPRDALPAALVEEGLMAVLRALDARDDSVRGPTNGSAAR